MSMNLADLYGSSSSTSTALQPTSVGGPDQGSVAPMGGVPPSTTSGTSDPRVAFSWLGFILLLVVWRVLIHLQGKG